MYGDALVYATQVAVVICNFLTNQHQMLGNYALWKQFDIIKKSENLMMMYCWNTERLYIDLIHVSLEKWKCSRSVVSDSLHPHEHQAPPSMGFSRQEYWSGLPFPSPGNLPDPGMKTRSPACRQTLYQLSYQRSPKDKYKCLPLPSISLESFAMYVQNLKYKLNYKSKNTTVGILHQSV